MKKTLLLVFIHGFKGSDNTFGRFPQDLAGLLSHSLPNLSVQSIQYPQFETRGDLAQCVSKFRDWLQDKVIDLEVENGTPSPTVDPSVRVVLCGHSMGGIVAVETLLAILKDEPVTMSEAGRGWANDTTNATTGAEAADGMGGSTAARLDVPEADGGKRSASAPPPMETSRLFFPYIQAILAFDTPYLGISPGVLAHGAEEHLNQASAAYKAFDTASNIFGWNTPRGASRVSNASAKGLPAVDNSSSSGLGKWGKYAMYGGAAAAIAGAAGAAYLNRNQINQGLVWAGSHLEFIGCLARGAELQKRVENMVEVSRSHHIGFANFYAALDEKVSRKTQYAGAMLGQDRTFCVIPKPARSASSSPTGTKRSAPSDPQQQQPASKRRKEAAEANMASEMQDGETVHQFTEDVSKGKGEWVKCVNRVAQDELRSHTSMFAPQRNPDYHAMLPRARGWIARWVDEGWYDGAEKAGGQDDGAERPEAEEGSAAQS